MFAEDQGSESEQSNEDLHRNPKKIKKQITTAVIFNPSIDLADLNP
jgi:hypothetical protein